MAIEVEVGTFTKDTATPTGTNVVSTSFTPKALIIWGNLGDVSEVERDGDINHSIGFSDGVNDKAVYNFDEDEVTSEVARRGFRTASCVCFINTSVLVLGDADFNASDFTINWTTNDATATHMHYIIYGGDDIGVQVGQFDKDTGAEPVSQDVATDADVRGITNNRGVVLMMNARGTATDGINNNAILNLGGTTRDDGTNEGSTSMLFDNGSSESECRQSFTESKAFQIVNPVDGNITAEADLTAWLDDGTNGFRLNWTTNIAVAYKVAFLIIKGGQWELGNETASTTIAKKVTTTLFKPKGVLMWGVRQTAPGSAPIEDLSYNIGASDVIKETSAQCTGVAATTETHTGTASSIIKSNRILTPVDPTAPTVDGEANIDSFNKKDFILDWTNAASSAWKFLWLICGDDLDVDVNFPYGSSIGGTSHANILFEERDKGIAVKLR